VSPDAPGAPKDTRSCSSSRCTEPQHLQLMSASPHKRSHSRSDAPVAGEAPSNPNGSLKSSIERHAASGERRQLASHKSSAALYISSVLASSSTSIPDSPTVGAKLKDSIHRAAERGNTETVLAYLKKKKASANLRNELGHTPLHIAALHNCYDVVDILLRNDADPNVQDNIGWSVLHFACSGKNEKLIQLLLDCPKIDGTIEESLVDAWRGGPSLQSRQIHHKDRVPKTDASECPPLLAPRLCGALPLSLGTASCVPTSQHCPLFSFGPRPGLPMAKPPPIPGLSNRPFLCFHTPVLPLVNILNDSLNTPLHYAAKSLLGMSRTTLKSFVEVRILFR
jgi:hypothetical protein